MSSFFDLFIDILPELWGGLQVTLFLTLISIIIGFIIGVSLALGKVYGNFFVAGACSGYIEVFRGTPMLVQIFILYYGLPNVNINLEPITAGLLALSLNSAAYQAEYLRGSIQSIESGQMIAARTMGMSKLQAIGNIILPQSLRLSIPAWSNELVYLIKYSTLVYLITVRELFYVANNIASQNFRYLEIFGILAIIYLVLTIIFTEIVDQFEKKVRIPGLGYREEEGVQRGAL